MKSDVRVVYVPLLGAWYVVRGPHKVPLGGSHPTKASALAWLNRR